MRPFLALLLLFRQAAPAADSARPERAPVLIELFTSEGCSSCPPADTLLAKLDELQPVTGVTVIALEEHVDYWDHQGWRDPFSSAEFTARQQRYAGLLHIESPYTPEMVIDGHSEFVGNDSERALHELATAALAPKVPVQVMVEDKSGDRISLAVNAPIGRYNRDREVAEAVAGQLQAAGIQATVKVQEWVTYSNLIGRRGLSPLYELGWNQPSADADGVITSLFTTNAPLSTYSNPEIDRLADEARGELDPVKRKALYKRIATILNDDAAWIVLFEYEDLYATSKRLHWQPRGDEFIRAYEMSVN